MIYHCDRCEMTITSPDDDILDEIHEHEEYHRDLDAAAQLSDVVPVAERAEMALGLVDALLTERGYPHDPLGDPVQEFTVGLDRGDSEGTARSPFTFSLLTYLAGEFLTRARETERQSSSLRHHVRLGGGLLPIYSDRGFHPVGFVLTNVDEYVGARLFPVAFPRDIVAFGITRLGSLRDRARFFSELTGVYSDAVRLSGQVVGLEAELLPTLRDLAGILRELVRRLRLQECGDTETETAEATEQATDRPDPQQHGFHESSPSAGDAGAHSVGEGQVTGDAESAPVTDATSSTHEPGSGHHALIVGNIEDASELRLQHEWLAGYHLTVPLHGTSLGPLCGVRIEKAAAPQSLEYDPGLAPTLRQLGVHLADVEWITDEPEAAS